jgi:carboxyl-terminal processing protease
MALDTAIENIRGPKDTTVTLTISTSDFKNVHEVSIVRDTIHIPSVKWEDQNGVAYLQMYNFNEESLGQFKKAVDEITAKKMKGIVLDLRNNPGGFLEIAVQASSEWLQNNDVVVKERDNQNREQVFQTEGPHRLRNIPTVILVNEGSASAAEIMSGALQDYGQAVLVGKKTFGKGSVQDLSELPDGSALKLTIAEWLTPKDRHINTVGIEPDVPVDPLWEEKDNKIVDHGLETAKKVLKQLQEGTFVKPEPVKAVEKK